MNLTRHLIGATAGDTREALSTYNAFRATLGHGKVSRGRALMGAPGDNAKTAKTVRPVYTLSLAPHREPLGAAREEALLGGEDGENVAGAEFEFLEGTAVGLEGETGRLGKGIDTACQEGLGGKSVFDFAEGGLLVFDTSKSARLKPGDRVSLDLSRAMAWIVPAAAGEQA